MAKNKTKSIPFSNTATETVIGVWEWQLGGVTWRYKASYGLNTGYIRDGECNYVVHCATLKDAAHFVEGFVAGTNVNWEEATPE